MILPVPKRWRRGKDLIAVGTALKIRRPVRLFRSTQADQVRLLDRAIEGFLGRLSAGSPRSSGHVAAKTLELVIADELGDGAGRITAPEAYQLVIGPNDIRLIGTDVPALRAGLVSLSRMVVAKDGRTALPAGQVIDWPSLPLRGFHLDLTCQALAFDYVRSFLERMANLKFNVVLLEWGDKFPYQGHRVLSHADAFSPRQVAELLEHAESLGLVVIPLLQTLAHVEFILRHPQFAHLSEVPGDIYQLATSSPESLVLAKQLVDQIIESHPNSPYVHLGADEAVQLGQGVSAEEVRRKGKGLAWVDYMNVICRHVQARGRTPMVWDDMLVGYPEGLNRFTRDCLLMHWSYTATTAVAADYFQPGIGRVNARTYRQMDVELRERYEPFWSLGGAKPPKTFYTAAPVAYLKQAGFRVVLAPAVRSFGDSYSAPRLRLHMDNCFQMARAAAEHGGLGLVATNWSVRRTVLETTIPGLMAAAEAAWNGGARPARDLDALVAGELADARTGELIRTLDSVGRFGMVLLNGVGPGSAWDRRHDRWGIAPLLGRVRKADMASLTASSRQVGHAQRIAQEAKAAQAGLARMGERGRGRNSLLSAWHYAARETAHKAQQWLFLWQVARLTRAGRGSATALARQGLGLLEEIRRCQREFKLVVGPSLTPGGVAEELDIRFGSEARLIRRLVRTLRAKLPRGELRSQLAGILGLRAAASAEKQ